MNPPVKKIKSLLIRAWNRESAADYRHVAPRGMPRRTLLTSVCWEIDMPVPEERLEPVREYLREAFPDWELADQGDGIRGAHTFRLTGQNALVHVLKVSRELLDDNQPAEISAILAHRGVAQALRDVADHRLLLTSHGLSRLAGVS
jgi:hypothetical protein